MTMDFLFLVENKILGKLFLHIDGIFLLLIMDSKKLKAYLKFKKLRKKLSQLLTLTAPITQLLCHIHSSLLYVSHLKEKLFLSIVKLKLI